MGLLKPHNLSTPLKHNHRPKIQTRKSRQLSLSATKWKAKREAVKPQHFNAIFKHDHHLRIQIANHGDRRFQRPIREPSEVLEKGHSLAALREGDGDA
jgi:hypothetical protein